MVLPHLAESAEAGRPGWYGPAVPELLAGTTGLVVGVANKRSIAWAIARKLDAAGARLALTYQNERTEGDVRKLAATLDGCDTVLPLDVQDDAQVADGVSAAAEALGGLDILVHAVAYARPEDLEGASWTPAARASTWRSTCRPTRSPRWRARPSPTCARAGAGRS